MLLKSTWVINAKIDFEFKSNIYHHGKNALKKPSQPIHNLDSVKDAVRAKRVVFTSKADVDRQNLGYGKEDVFACICELTASHFRKTHVYGRADHQVQDDYRIRHTLNGTTTLLYIKLALLPNGCLLASFHQST